jgi:hypothetical protein
MNYRKLDFKDLANFSGHINFMTSICGGCQTCKKLVVTSEEASRP